MLDVKQIREDFPVLNTWQHGCPLIYLDNAATMQMPQPRKATVSASATV